MSTTEQDRSTDEFERHRPRLIGIAYRILGSRADAEDVVQDCYLRWLLQPAATIERPGAWLTTVVTRRALDELKRAQRTRVDYVGEWLPEPLATDAGGSPEDIVGLSSALSTAFLMLLERLSPKERAAYLLRDVFEQSYEGVAQTLDISAPACRKLVSRARSNLQADEGRYPPEPAQQRRLLDAFMQAVRSGDAAPLGQLLAGDVMLRADGGGKVAALRRPVQGAEVMRIISTRLHRWWQAYAFKERELNGGPGLLLMHDHAVVAAVTFSFNGAGQVCDIQIMRNPEKLVGLSRPALQ